MNKKILFSTILSLGTLIQITFPMEQGLFFEQKEKKCSDFEIFYENSLGKPVNTLTDTSCPFKINHEGFPLCKICGTKWCSDKNESIYATCTKCQQRTNLLLSNTVAIIFPQKIDSVNVSNLNQINSSISNSYFLKENELIENKHVLYVTGKENVDFFYLLSSNSNILESIVTVLNIIRQNTNSILIYPKLTITPKDLGVKIPQKYADQSNFGTMVVQDRSDLFQYILIFKKI